MKKFNLYEALKEKGFEQVEVIDPSVVLVRNWSRDMDLAWYGKMNVRLTVKVVFGSTCVSVYYLQDGCEFKRKVHLQDKRAYNAIIATVNNNGYEF